MAHWLDCAARGAVSRAKGWPRLLLFPMIMLAVFPGAALSLRFEPSSETSWAPLETHMGGDFSAGEMQNTVFADGGVRLDSEDGFQTNLHPPYDRFGLYSSPVVNAPAAFRSFKIGYNGQDQPGSAIELEVRALAQDGRWSPWQEVEGAEAAFSSATPSTALQYRATLLSEDAGISPTLSQVSLETSLLAADTPPADYQAMATRPTVRLYATREGLVGRTTANGHQIAERDRFVALPSKKALNLKDGREYQVEISYNGRKATAPVWDVGPWNTKDDYWNAPRELFNDLPRFTPQVNAAFFNNHNNGNDQYGRMVLYPAAIDIADGTFWDDLGMKNSDWVDVTFLWVDAAAPPLVPMAPVVPKKGPIPQPIGSGAQAMQAAQPAAPTPTPTPTPIPKTWYFAEGSTGKPFDTWLLLQNPDPEPAKAKVTYMLPNGGQHIAEYGLKPTSRTSILLNSVVPDTEVSTMIESDRYILAERAMYFGSEGHATAGAISPSTNWYFAEGSTTSSFETWILMQNPNKEPATATLTFYKEDGSTVVHTMLIPHVSRASLLVNQVVPEASVGAKIEADRPIVAERAVYKDKGKAGTDSMGATTLSKNWYMAEGITRGGFDTWVLLLNPNDVVANATLTFMAEDGSPVTRKYVLQPRSRVSVYVNPELPNARVATQVESDLPIVAERSVYFPEGQGAHGSMAAPALSKKWFLPEGSTAKPFSENILLMNPHASPANVTATFMKEDGEAVEKKYTLKPTSRFTLQMNDILPDTAFSTKVESDQPIVAERSMYFSDWRGGHSSMGIPK